MSRVQPSAAPDTMSQLKQGLPLALLLSGVVLVLGVIGFFVYSWLTGTGDLGPLRPQNTAQEQEATVNDVQTWLDDARSAMREDRVIQPAGNNALELYLRVLQKEPDNRAAREALTELIPIATAPAERLIETGDFQDGERVVALLEKADPGSVLVSAMRQKLGLAQRAAEQQKALLEQRERQAALAEAQSRVNNTAQTEPATPPPSATPTAADINPFGSNPSVAAARSSAATGASSSDTRPPPATSAATPPPPSLASATPAPPVSTATAPQTRNFELIRSVPPSYPQRALKQRTEGWVEVEFTITPGGDVTDAKVVAAQPRRGEFDREALRAVQQWKFRPRMENGKPVSASAKQRVNFTLGN